MNQIEERYLQRIQKLMEDKIGLLPNSLSHNNWMSCIQKRMEACLSEDMGEYYTHLLNSLTELEEIINLIVIPETWFFREKKGLDFLSAYVKENQEKYRKGRPLSILSLGCSTGEEPYSIVMCLFEAGMPLGSFRVEAVDVSRRLLDIAQKGIYGKNSFRGNYQDFQRRYFHSLQEGYQLKDEIRFTVRFKKGNIVDYPNSQTAGKFDVVFCRNLLIYLSPQLQYNLLKRIKKALIPGGVLILGEAEYDKIRHLDFETVTYANISAFCKKGQDEEHLNYQSDLFRELEEMIGSGKKGEKEKARKEEKKKDYESARKMADQGNLAEADKMIDEYIKSYGQDAEACYLKGLIRHAMGHAAEALNFFRKAVHLDPEHKEAATYLDLMSRESKEAEVEKGKSSG